MVSKSKDKESADWFIGKARSASGYRKNIVNSDTRGRDATVIGRMYFFYYDPKLKKTLPVYDRFPLVFPIEMYGDGFLGLNLHYLNVAERAALIHRLSEYKSNNKMNSNTRLRLTYDLLANTKKLATLSKPCIKRYLFDHVRSKFIEIEANEWDKAINLPVELFVHKG
jgi:hypothetical protein